uniref:Uncharacterized protein n=1 Tax=Romanomermis culicivorax TaxID=13658 RepID=A0A915JWK6_ROMCU
MEKFSYHWLLRFLSFSFMCASIGQLVNAYFALQFCQELQELNVHKIALVCGVVSLLAGCLFLFCSICILFQLIFSEMDCFCNLCTFFSISSLFMVTLATLGGLTVVLPLGLETDVGPNMKELIRVYRGNKSNHGIDFIQEK